jgi:hypothetical protein
MPKGRELERDFEWLPPGAVRDCPKLPSARNTQRIISGQTCPRRSVESISFGKFNKVLVLLANIY